MEYTTAFDVTQAGYRQWTFGAQGLVMLAFALAQPALKKAGILPRQSPRMEKWFPRVFIGFAVFWIVATSLGTYLEYRSAVGDLRDNRAQVVEGVVSNFKPMPYAGHATESFTVEGVQFSYSDFIVTAGFNNTASHGGPIREGLPVKIWHSHGKILRLDVGKAD